MKANGRIVWTDKNGWHDGPPAHVALNDGRLAATPMPRITRAGTLTVTVAFDTGATDVDLADLHDAIKNAVADATGATDVSVKNGGAALIHSNRLPAFGGRAPS